MKRRTCYHFKFWRLTNTRIFEHPFDINTFDNKFKMIRLPNYNLLKEKVQNSNWRGRHYLASSSFIHKVKRLFSKELILKMMIKLKIWPKNGNLSILRGVKKVKRRRRKYSRGNEGIRKRWRRKIISLIKAKWFVIEIKALASLSRARR